MTSEAPKIEEFADLLIKLVRDEAIDASERLADGRTKGRRAERWREVIDRSSARDAVEALIPDIVDHALFYLLDAVDNDSLHLAWHRDDGSWVGLSELGRGEMAGWLMMGKGGWIDRFSTKPYFDPSPDLQM